MTYIPENKRAYALLCDYLDAEQRQCLEEHGHFYVTVRRSGRNWYFLLKDGWEVYRVGSTGSITMYCITGYPEDAWALGTEQNRLPREDALLTQMLLLQCAYSLFLTTACSVGLRPCGDEDYILRARNIDWRLGYPGRVRSAEDAAALQSPALASPLRFIWPESG